MEFNLEIKGLDKFNNFANNLIKEQLPFAVAKALTDTVMDVQGEILQTISSLFTLRTRWWMPHTKYGFNIISAKKSDFPNQSASVYTDAPWMRDQEEGGLKVAHNDKKLIAIPTENVMRTGSGLIREDQKPAALLMGYYLKGRSKKRGGGRAVKLTTTEAFIAEIKGRLGIYLRTPGHTVKLMYTLRPDALITPRLHFFETGRRIINQNWQRNFETNLSEAIRTAK